MTVMSRITAMILATLVLVTAQSAAVARSMPDATGQMVLCTGTGPLMVYMDAEGNPTAPPQICPDYALSLILALDLPEMALAASGQWVAVTGFEQIVTHAVMQRVIAHARSPPRPV